MLDETGTPAQRCEVAVERPLFVTQLDIEVAVTADRLRANV